jgi:hypothetical protein
VSGSFLQNTSTHCSGGRRRRTDDDDICSQVAQKGENEGTKTMRPVIFIDCEVISLAPCPEVRLLNFKKVSKTKRVDTGSSLADDGNEI